MLLTGERHQMEMQLGEVIAGYEEFFEFNPRELNLVEPLRTLRMMNHAAWIAKRWDDPAFPKGFPWFNTERYWGEHLLDLKVQLSALDEPVLKLL
jgi:Ser/Thr protein kinase RdoA (MazF antagonist)